MKDTKVEWTKRTISMPKDLYDRVKQDSNETGKNFSEMIRIILLKHYYNI